MFNIAIAIVTAAIIAAGWVFLAPEGDNRADLTVKDAAMQLYKQTGTLVGAYRGAVVGNWVPAGLSEDVHGMFTLAAGATTAYAAVLAATATSAQPGYNDSTDTNHAWALTDRLSFGGVTTHAFVLDLGTDAGAAGVCKAYNAKTMNLAGAPPAAAVTAANLVAADDTATQYAFDTATTGWPNSIAATNACVQTSDDHFVVVGVAQHIPATLW